jgi:hypothetical protein
MSEEFEVESRIEPEERAPRTWLIPAIAVTTAVLAVAAAYSSMLAGESAHESLAALNRAAILQAQASDQWAFYQAEGIKRHTFEVQRDIGRLQTDAPHVALTASQDEQARRYAAQQAVIRRDAETLEHRRALPAAGPSGGGVPGWYRDLFRCGDRASSGALVPRAGRGGRRRRDPGAGPAGARRGLSEAENCRRIAGGPAQKT